MAQVLAVQGDVRHGFSYNCSFNHDFARITGLAASSNGNLVLCDHNNKTLILVDNIGNYVTKLNVDSEPFDVAITSQNVGYITQPNTRSVLQIDPKRMVVLSKNTCNDLRTTLTSTVKGSRSLVVNEMGNSYIYDYSNISTIGDNGHYTGNEGVCIGTGVVRTHTVDGQTYFSCTVGTNDIMIRKRGIPANINSAGKDSSITTIDTPTDICSDDNGHLYVSGQDSNNIHRLTQAGKVIDIALHSQHGIKQPVTMCFNKNYTRLYIVNDWGKSVLIFDVC
ncbi:Hypothetical predicted protein [Mytilus galloprovincialis]|uniref:Uncharacterized protein n=1 Tax=Mytilus galloprovincialis TaxID=29158 RepID=A0A8B6HAQ5_MYTGA|nr:Hypothetical predicted protein [Mytilus galloprovincialis]